MEKVLGNGRMPVIFLNGKPNSVPGMKSYLLQIGEINAR